jgi:hypothetical protein
MEEGLQHGPPTHEPQGAHPSSLCNSPRIGANGERVLLMNEGIWGARSMHASAEKFPVSSEPKSADDVAKPETRVHRMFCYRQRPCAPC